MAQPTASTPRGTAALHARHSPCFSLKSDGNLYVKCARRHTKATVQDNIVLGQIACTSGKKFGGATATVVSVIYQASLTHTLLYIPSSHIGDWWMRIAHTDQLAQKIIIRKNDHNLKTKISSAKVSLQKAAARSRL